MKSDDANDWITLCLCLWTSVKALHRIRFRKYITKLKVTKQLHQQILQKTDRISPFHINCVSVCVCVCDSWQRNFKITRKRLPTMIMKLFDPQLVLLSHDPRLRDWLPHGNANWVVSHPSLWLAALNFSFSFLFLFCFFSFFFVFFLWKCFFFLFSAYRFFFLGLCFHQMLERTIIAFH